MANIHYIHINSIKDRATGEYSGQNWTTYMQTPIRADKYFTVNVESIEFPNVVYTFPTYASILWYYVGEDLRSIELNTQITYANGQEVVDDLNKNQSDIVFAYDHTCERISAMPKVANAKIVASYIYGPEPANVYNSAVDRLGFTQPQDYLEFSRLAFGKPAVAASPLRLLRTSCYYLTCDELSSARSCVPNNSAVKGILVRVGSGGYGFLSQFQYSYYYGLCIQQSMLEKLTFRVLDDELMEIDTSINQPIALTLKICAY